MHTDRAQTVLATVLAQLRSFALSVCVFCCPVLASCVSRCGLRSVTVARMLLELTPSCDQLSGRPMVSATVHGSVLPECDDDGQELAPVTPLTSCSVEALVCCSTICCLSHGDSESISLSCRRAILVSLRVSAI